MCSGFLSWQDVSVRPGEKALRGDSFVRCRGPSDWLSNFSEADAKIGITTWKARSQLSQPRARYFQVKRCWRRGLRPCCFRPCATTEKALVVARRCFVLLPASAQQRASASTDQRRLQILPELEP